MKAEAVLALVEDDERLKPLDRSKCPPEYVLIGDTVFTDAESMTGDGLRDAWYHRDRIVADTVARVVAALRDLSDGLVDVDARMADSLATVADALACGEVEL